ncbi:MAG: hydrogenase small subunit [Planctomycetota bacterium]|jgi:hydrogenase small subunit
MKITRREFLKGAAGMAGVLGLDAAGLLRLQEALAAAGAPPVIWLQGQSCSGCSVSFLNSIYYATADEVLLNSINLEYHPTVMAAAGDLAISAAQVARPSTGELAGLASEWLETGDNLSFDLNGDNIVNFLDYALLARRGYILVVEGSIPAGADGHFCHIGGEMTMLDALGIFSKHASHIVAVGTCAAYAGVVGGASNPTTAMGVKDALGYLGQSRPVVNIPGCPAHPDWLVGTLIDVLTGQTLALDEYGRPVRFFGEKIHEEGNCPYKGTPQIYGLGGKGCLKELGCKGPETYADCFSRKWNNPAKGQEGVNWCIGAGSPCIGCTEPQFPNGDFAPFYRLYGLAYNAGITIWKAEYNVSSQGLLVRATTDTQPADALTVQGYGVMSWKANANHYEYRAAPVSDPGGSITVTSDAGGSVTCSVEYDG